MVARKKAPKAKPATKKPVAARRAASNKVPGRDRLIRAESLSEGRDETTKPEAAAKKSAARSTSERKKAAPRTRKTTETAQKPAAAKRGVGRPSVRSEELAERICALLMEGLSLREICTRKGFPDRNTILRWLGDDHNFAAKYAHARELQAEALFEDMHDIESRVLSKAIAPDVARVVLASKQWRAAKLAPKKYSDRHIHQGDDEAAPIQLETTELSATQRATRLVSLLALQQRTGAKSA